MRKVYSILIALVIIIAASFFLLWKSNTESPLSILQISVLPPQVPLSQEMAVTLVLKNEGKENVQDISIETACNEFCDDSHKINLNPGYKQVLSRGEAESIIFRNITATGSVSDKGTIKTIIRYIYNNRNIESLKTVKFSVTPEVHI